MELAEHSVYDEDTSPDATGQVQAINEGPARLMSEVNKAFDRCWSNLDDVGKELADAGAHVLVLIVDDYAAALTALTAALERAGIEVDGAGDAATAVVMARTKMYDAAVVDIHLPGASGIQLALELRRIAPDMPVILISGEEVEANLIHSCGAVAFLPKPFSPAELLRELANHIPALAVARDRIG